MTLSYVQTDATTPNIVGPTMLGIVASVSSVACKRMQEFLTIVTLNNMQQDATGYANGRNR